MKKLLALLLAMLLLVAAFVLVSCDEEETNGQSSGSAVESDDFEVTIEELEDYYSNILGSDFSDLFNGGNGIELPDDEF